jgi:hypothetical protein
MTPRLERQARNEALVRQVNERIEEMDRAAEAQGWVSEDGRFEFHCECGAGDVCTARVFMTIEEYERVRQQDDRFALAPGHERGELERVVERHERFVIVDKIAEVEREVSDDPRGAPSR